MIRQQINGLCMIYLIVLLPLAISHAHAAAITSVDIAGSAGTPGIRSANDYVSIDVEHDGSDSATVTIAEIPSITFSCAQGICSASFKPAADVNNPYTITLQLNEGTAVADTEQVSVLTDSNAPTILASFEQQNANALLATVSARDTLCDGFSCEGQCSGFKSIDILFDGQIAKNVLETQRTCAFSEQTVSVPLTFTGTKTVNVCARAIDQAGNTQMSCDDIRIDRSAPSVSRIQLAADGVVMDHVNSIPKQGLSLAITIQEDAIEGGSITVDASNLVQIASLKPTLEQVPVGTQTCEPTGTGFLCFSDPIIFAPDPSQNSFTLSIDLVDAAGNNITRTATLATQIDNAPPTLQSIRIGQPIEGDYWVNGSGFDITFTLNDAGAGFDEDRVFVRIDGVSNITGGTTLSPQGTIVTDPDIRSTLYNIPCTQQGASWQCSRPMREIVLGGDEGARYQLSFENSYDDAQNALVVNPQVFHLDNKAPTLLFETATAVTDIGPGVIGESTLIAEGGELNYYALFEDVNEVTSVLDLSDAVEDGGELQGSCAQLSDFDPETSRGIEALIQHLIPQGFYADNSSDEMGRILENDHDFLYTLDFNKVELTPGRKLWLCEWTQAGIIAQGASTFSLSYEDAIGNAVAEENMALDTLSRQEGRGPYWEITQTDFAPTVGLDRFSWNQLGVFSYHKILFDPIGDIKMAAMVLDPQDCQGTDMDYVNINFEEQSFAINYMGFSSARNFGKTEFEDVIEIHYDPNKVPPVSQNNLMFNCSAKIISLIGGNSISELEQVNFTLEIPVISNQFGDPLPEVAARVESYMDESRAKREWITKMNRVFKVLKAICSTIGIINTATGVVQALADTLKGIPFTRPAGESVAEFATGMNFLNSGGFGAFYTGFCSTFLGCRLAGKPATDNQRAAIREEAGTGQAGTPRLFSPDDSDGFVQECKDKETEAGGGFKKVLCFIQLPATYMRTFYSYTLGLQWIAYTAGGADRFDNTNFNPDNDVFQGSTQSRTEATIQAFDSGFDPEQSMFASFVTMCVPGIISNFDKLRQIECRRIVCYQQDLATGSTVAQCESEHAFQHCLFIKGMIFNAIPLMQFMSQLSQALQQALQDGYQYFITMGFDSACLVCKYNQKFSEGGFCTACHAVKFFSLTSVLVEDIISTPDKFKSAVADNWCDQVQWKTPEDQADEGGENDA